MTSWTAIVLAAGRGPGDPLARAYGVTHKCLIPVGGVPMLARVVGALREHPSIARIAVSVDQPEVAAEALGVAGDVTVVRSGQSAPDSVLKTLDEVGRVYPVLVTTADHALLDSVLLDHFLGVAEAKSADVAIGFAAAETILAAYPDARRTFLTFGKDRVSGCNLYGLFDDRALKAVELWRELDRDRKKPWKIVQAFGFEALFRYFTRRTSLEGALGLASRRLGLTARSVMMPFAEASIDVDKPEDKELVDRILLNRKGL